MRHSTAPRAKKKVARHPPTIDRPLLIIRSAIALAIVAAGVTVTAYSGPDDKYAVKDANGIALSEIRGYENWASVGPSQVDEGAGQRDAIKLTVANTTMIDAYRAGIPGNGKPFPDGSKIVKIEWSRKKSAEAPYSATVPDALRKVGLIVKDSKRFPETHGWGYAQFVYDPATGKFSPQHTDANFAKARCHTCHLAVAAKDYMFTDYAAR